MSEEVEDKAVILYVDDEPSNLAAFKAAFRRYYTIHTASSAKEGLEILNKTNVSIVITDQRMPEMTGVQFLEVVVTNHPSTLRMILTGFTDVEAIIKAINRGRILRYITKPWNADDLKMIIDDAIRLYRSEQKNHSLMLNLQREVIEKENLVNVFSKYVPEHIAHDALKYGSEVNLSSENRILGVLFCDIRNSSYIAEKLSPEELAKFLNEYFTRMNECIIKNKGYVDKFLGDGILALFGAPVAYMDNSWNAVSCGFDMMNLVNEMNEEYKKTLGIELAIGIAVNTGEVVVGNFGSKDRLQYTAIGDVVNVTFRIEEYTHAENNIFLISKATYDLVKDKVNVEDFGLKPIRGKQTEVHIYKVLNKIE